MSFVLHRMIDEAAGRRPESIAVRCGSDELSYEQLFRGSNGLARTLIESGIHPQDRVAVLLGKGLRVPTAFYGVLASGAALVPIDPGSPVEQIVRVLQASGAKALVTEPGKTETVRRVLEQVDRLATIVGVSPDADLSGRIISWTEVDGAACDRPPDVHVIDLDPAYILHTSGSTGTPKLILHTHRSASSFVDWAVAEYALTPADRLSNHSSHHTCFATFDYYAAARAGATTIVLPPAALKMPASLASLLEREQVSVWYSVPTALVQLSLRGMLDQRDLGSLSWVLFAGENFPEKHLRQVMTQIPSARFSHVYGSTEVNVCTYYHLPDVSAVRDTLPIGRACSTSRTRVVDDDLAPVPSGGTGELLVQGSTVMSGYWGEPDKTRSALIQLPTDDGLERTYFRTGDRVRTLDDGNLAFVARSDFQVKIRGHRVELEEVENALLELDPVEESAAVAVEDGEGSQVILAAVVVGSDADADQRSLLTGLRATLPTHALPTEIRFVPALPRTATGKVDRRTLRSQLAQRDRTDVD